MRAKEKLMVMRSLTRIVAIVIAIVPAMLSASSSAAALAGGRAYEMVSPPFKGGYPTFFVVGTSTDGEAVDFGSVGAFAGAPFDFAINRYLARRGTDGWRTSPLSQAEPDAVWAGPEQATPDLAHFLYRVAPGGNYGSAELSPSRTFWSSEFGSGLTQMSPSMETEGHVALGASPGANGVSRNFSKVILNIFSDEPPYHLLSRDETQEGGALLEAEGPLSALRLVAVRDDGKAIKRYCTVHLGGESGAFNAVSRDGSEVFFTTDINAQVPTNCVDNPASPATLFVRVDGAKTLTISRPLPALCTEEPCAAAAAATPKQAVFQGASEDGSKVFFTTTQPLVNGDKDGGNDLYMAQIGEVAGESAVTNMVQVSHDANRSEGADVQGAVLAVSPDGSHVYFVAHGRLTEMPSPEGTEPAPGADNLYVYNAVTGQLKFIADLCSDAKQSGSVPDPQCGSNLNGEVLGGSIVNDSQLWQPGGEHVEAQVADQGRFLVFSTYAALVPSDTDTAKDVYRYDSETGRIDRVSVGAEGYEGNNDAFDAGMASRPRFNGGLEEQYEMATRAISEDGASIVFSTNEPLAPAATNGQTDIYEWHEGRVGLISTGDATRADRAPVIAPSGRDIFFETIAGIDSQDADGQYDIYDARIGGGFPVVDASRSECTADACQGPLSGAPTALLPDSFSQPAVGNLHTIAKAEPKIKRRNSVTPAQRLHRALNACSKKRGAKRARCEARARVRYRKKAPAKANPSQRGR